MLALPSGRSVSSSLQWQRSETLRAWKSPRPLVLPRLERASLSTLWILTVTGGSPGRLVRNGGVQPSSPASGTRGSERPRAFLLLRFSSESQVLHRQ